MGICSHLSHAQPFERSFHRDPKRVGRGYVSLLEPSCVAVAWDALTEAQISSGSVGIEPILLYLLADFR